jgi:hypothetical protein
MTADRYTAAPMPVEAIQYTGDRDALTRWIKPTDAYGPDTQELLANNEISQGDWLVRDDGQLDLYSDAKFGARFTPTDEEEANRVDFTLNLADGDFATVSISGWKRGSSVARAMMHMGSPDVVIAFIKERAAEGDVSIVTLAQELGELANPT